MILYRVRTFRAENRDGRRPSTSTELSLLGAAAGRRAACFVVAMKVVLYAVLCRSNKSAFNEGAPLQLAAATADTVGRDAQGSGTVVSKSR